MQVDIIDETDTFSPEQLLMVKNLLIFASGREELACKAEVVVTIVTAEEIKHLNRQYRNKDIATDVLSFPMYEEDDLKVLAPDQELMLGDIVISTPHVLRQATEYEHTIERELGFLVLHGFLHLLGYDHIEKDKEREMFSRQEMLLKEYGLQRRGRDD